MDKATLNKFFPGWEPVITEDTKGIDFDIPIKGKYLCRIIALNHLEGIGKNSGEPYNFVSLKLQVEEDIEGDASNNRTLDKTYSCVDKTVTMKNGKTFDIVAEDELKKLLNDLFTAGLLDALEMSNGGYEGILEVADGLTDKLMKISAYKTKGGKQAIKVVKEHVLTGKGVSEGTASNDDWEE